MADDLLYIDFETRSRVNLITEGGYNYATDPSTQVLMMAWGFNDEPSALWVPGEPFPDDIAPHIKNDGMIKAFNAQFERLMMWYVLCPDYGVPEPRLEQFYCIAAQSRANNMPGNLADCARAIGGDHQKNFRGKALIQLFCIPQHDGRFNDAQSHPVEWQEFCDYCIDDNEAARDVCSYLRELTATELQDYWVNEEINDAGLLVDVDLAASAEQYANEEQRNLVDSIIQLTNGEVQKARGKFMTEWVYECLPDDETRAHMHVYKKGELRLTFDKSTRARLMAEPDIAGHVKEVIEASDFAQASSTGKFKSMRLRADPEDQRVRGSYIFNGASSTGRASARGLQLHNFPRKGYKRDVSDNIREHMLCDVAPEDLTELSGDNVMQTLKGLLRYSIKARPGYTFVCGDLEQIEGRVNPWLSMGISPGVTQAAEIKLSQYADPTIDVYCETASDILGYQVNKEDDERQGYGKVPELALGFGGGVNAFGGMAKNYGVNLERDVMEMIVKRWRINNQWAQPFWAALFAAAIDAVQSPGSVHSAGRVSYMYQTEMLGGTLWCLLPSGRLLAYPQARVEWKENKFGSMSWELSAMKAAWKPKADETEWPRNHLYGGLMCENVTQAVANDVLRALLATLKLDYEAPVCGHTHDEALLEVLIEDAPQWKELLDEVMVRELPWSQGLPLATGSWIGDRYKK